jgi:hypothetical protein
VQGHEVVETAWTRATAKVPTTGRVVNALFTTHAFNTLLFKILVYTAHNVYCSLQQLLKFI